MAKLTAKQQSFVDEYLVNSNATQAAIRAGYSEKTVYSQGQRLLKNVEVKKRLEELREQSTTEKIMTAKERKEWLSNVIKGVEVDNYGKPIWMESRLRAMDILNKMDGEYTEKVDLNGNINIGWFLDEEEEETE